MFLTNKLIEQPPVNKYKRSEPTNNRPTVTNHAA